MDPCTLREHDLIAGPEEDHGNQPLAYDHDQPSQDPVTSRLHAPLQDQATNAGEPRENSEGRKEVAWPTDGHELHRGLE